MSSPAPEAVLSLFLTALLYVGHRSDLGRRALLSLACAVGIAYVLLFQALLGSPLFRAVTANLQALLVLAGAAFAVMTVIDR
ncbi:hypothetical protein [Haloarchaeobius amylolyticus]|uniref:hypothetical protein n=1 Tax=Haloarchaeobius amylolyticus TaxID=1198296 RepID=UPI0022707241|nr:hypothetical protein [Haloarchaeobius amylolyticus]